MPRKAVEIEFFDLCKGPHESNAQLTAYLATKVNEPMPRETTENLTPNYAGANGGGLETGRQFQIGE